MPLRRKNNEEDGSQNVTVGSFFAEDGGEPSSRPVSQPRRQETPRAYYDEEPEPKKRNPIAEKIASKKQERKLIAVPRDSKGQPKKFISEKGKERRTQLLFCAIMIFAVVGLFNSCRSVLFPSTPTVDRASLNIPEAVAVWGDIAVSEAEKFVEGKFSEMLQMAGETEIAQASEASFYRVIKSAVLSSTPNGENQETHEIGIVGEAEILRTQGRNFFGDAQLKAEGLKVKIVLGLKDGRLVHTSQPSVESFPEIADNAEICEREPFTEEPADLAVLSEWGDAWLKGEKGKLFEIASETRPGIEYSGWGNIAAPRYLKGMLSFTQSCNFDNDNVITVLMEAGSCDTGTSLLIYQNLLIDAFGTPNPIVKGWSDVNTLPSESGTESEDTNDLPLVTDNVNCPAENQVAVSDAEEDLLFSAAQPDPSGFTEDSQLDSAEPSLPPVATTIQPSALQLPTSDEESIGSPETSDSTTSATTAAATADSEPVATTAAASESDAESAIQQSAEENAPLEQQTAPEAENADSPLETS